MKRATNAINTVVMPSRDYMLPKTWRVGHGWSHVLQRYLRALCYTLNVHTLIMLALSCISVYVCTRYQFKYNMVGRWAPLA